MNYKLFFTFLLLLPMQASAITPQQGLNQAAQGTGLNTSNNIPQIISYLVNALLGLLGTIFIILIILGGFKWMTSLGNASKIDEAKQMISNAVIGLVIVLAAYAISRFILSAVVDSTSGGGGAQSQS